MSIPIIDTKMLRLLRNYAQLHMLQMHRVTWLLFTGHFFWIFSRLGQGSPRK